MEIHLDIDLTPEQFEMAASDLLSGIHNDWSIIRLIILMTPEYRLAEQAKNPLCIDAERVELAVEAYRQGAQPGIKTHFHGWLEA